MWQRQTERNLLFLEILYSLPMELSKISLCGQFLYILEDLPGSQHLFRHSAWSPHEIGWLSKVIKLTTSHNHPSPLRQSNSVDFLVTRGTHFLFARWCKTGKDWDGNNWHKWKLSRDNVGGKPAIIGIKVIDRWRATFKLWEDFQSEVPIPRPS